MSIENKDLKERISALSPAKRALLEKRLRGEGSKRSQSEHILPRPDQARIPLSFTQQRIWLSEETEPGNPFNIVSRAFSLDGLLDTGLLRESVNGILLRHESLRTFFLSTGGETFQVAVPHLPLEMPMIDLRDIPEGNREGHARSLASKESLRPFVLREGPLFRVVLFKLEEEKHILLLSIHRIVSDCWSVGIFFQELSRFYDAFSRGDHPSLPELPVQFADFAHWQSQYFREKLLAEQITYWGKQLEGIMPELKLPYDHLPATGSLYRGESQSLLISKRATESLKALSRQEGVTLFVTFLAVLNVLLYRNTGQEDIVVGSNFANRNRPDTQGLIGSFANTLPIRTSLYGGIRFRELLGRVRKVAFEGFTYQAIPFETILEKLNEDRERDRIHLLPVIISMRNFPSLPIVLSGMTMKELELDFQFAKHDLTVEIMEKDEGINILFRYNSDRFQYDTISRLVKQWESLIDGVLSDPERDLSSLPLASEETLPGGIYPIYEKEGTGRQKSFIAPRDPEEVWLAGVWETILSVKPISVGDNFFELGGNSLQVMQLISEIEGHYGKSIPPSALFHSPTLASLAEMVREDSWETLHKALVAIQSSGSRPPFFCVPGHFGNTIQFRDLSAILGPDQPFYSLQFPSLDGREPINYQGIEDMARDFVEEIRSLQPGGPYYLGGYCFGGKVAFEISRQLHAQGQKVAFLALINAYAPGNPRYIPHYDFLPFRFLRSVQKTAGILNIAAHLESGQKLAYILQEAKKNRSTLSHNIRQGIKKFLAKFSIHVGNPLSEKWRAIREVNHRIMDGYQPEIIPGKVALFRAAKEFYGIQFNPTFGWEHHVSEGIEVFEYPSYMRVDWILSQPRVRILAGLLKTALEKAQSEQGVKLQ